MCVCVLRAFVTHTHTHTRTHTHTNTHRTPPLTTTLHTHTYIYTHTLGTYICRYTWGSTSKPTLSPGESWCGGGGGFLSQKLRSTFCVTPAAASDFERVNLRCFSCLTFPRFFSLCRIFQNSVALIVLKINDTTCMYRYYIYVYMYIHIHVYIVS